MDLWQAVKEVGFPIAVAGYVLIRLNGKMDKLTDAILQLNETFRTSLVSVRADTKEAALVVKIQQQEDLAKLLDAIRANK